MKLGEISFQTSGWGGRIRTSEMPESKSGALGHLATPQWNIAFFHTVWRCFQINSKRTKQPAKIGRILIATPVYVNEKLEKVNAFFPQIQPYHKNPAIFV